MKPGGGRVPTVGPETERDLARLARSDLVRLIATAGRSGARLGADGPVAWSGPPQGELSELEPLPEPELRELLRATLEAVVRLVGGMVQAHGGQPDYTNLFETVRREADELGYNYRQVIFELYSLLPFWEGQVTRSGAGSTLEATASIRAELPGLLARHSIDSVLDAPCGDFHWARHVDWSGVRYVGVDVVADLVAQNRERYAGDGIRFEHADIARDELPRARAVLCRDCLFHFSVADLARTLANFRRTGATYLLTSTFPALSENRAIATGDFHPINLEIAPYRFPAPLERVRDAPLEKYLGLWRFRDLPAP
jgi:SAM-dependent methyltransferase